MESLSARVRKAEFEARIFVSLGIVILVCVLSYVVLPDTPTSIVGLGRLVGISSNASFTLGCLTLALIMTAVSLLRMWAGTVLSSHRVMAFRVRSDSLITSGPYLIVRNPIYFADLIAMCGFAFILPLTGLILPVLFYLHYLQLIAHEEESFERNFTQNYEDYLKDVPRLIPNLKSIRSFSRVLREFQINRDGFRHNAPFLFFIPGFIVAAVTHELIHAVVIGFPGVIDWAVVHTKIGVRRRPLTEEALGRGEVTASAKKVFGDILYSQCWEDPSLDRAAFNITPDDVVFSITSGGCNVLTFLLDDPRKVIALDLNRTQNYLLELKIAAFEYLTYDELLEFLGVWSSDRRRDLYNRVRVGLGRESFEYWDHQPNKIEQGIIHCGKYERYLSLLRRWVTRFMGQSLIDQFFTTEDPEERARLFHERWENIWWWLFTRVLLSRTTMTLLFEKAFFEYLDESFSFGEHFARKAERALTELPAKKNYFLSYILLGKFFGEEHLPPYLHRENYEIIRGRLDRIEIVSDSCEHYFTTLPDDSISKFNFTNIFEWMSLGAYEQLLKEAIRVSRDGAMMTYRNLLVLRERPLSLQVHIHPQRVQARALHDRDLSFIYSNYVVERIVKENRTCLTPSELRVIAAR